MCRRRTVLMLVLTAVIAAGGSTAMAFRDDFEGAAGSPPSAANWDVYKPQGTETVELDGQGVLDIIDSAGWDHTGIFQKVGNPVAGDGVIAVEFRCLLPPGNPYGWYMTGLTNSFRGAGSDMEWDRSHGAFVFSNQANGVHRCGGYIFGPTDDANPDTAAYGDHNGSSNVISEGEWYIGRIEVDTQNRIGNWSMTEDFGDHNEVYSAALDYSEQEWPEFDVSEWYFYAVMTTGASGPTLRLDWVDITGGGPCSPGDADGDGDVDDDDLSLLLANWGQTTDCAHGEFSGVPPVDDDDLSLLLANWTGPLSAVPEPATLAVVALGAVAVLQRKR